MKWVHTKCLRSWRLTVKRIRGTTPNFCEVCRKPYVFRKAMHQYRIVNKQYQTLDLKTLNQQMLKFIVMNIIRLLILCYTTSPTFLYYSYCTLCIDFAQLLLRFRSLVFGRFFNFEGVNGRYEYRERCANYLALFLAVITCVLIEWVVMTLIYEPTDTDKMRRNLMKMNAFFVLMSMEKNVLFMIYDFDRIEMPYEFLRNLDVNKLSWLYTIFIMFFVTTFIISMEGMIYLIY